MMFTAFSISSYFLIYTTFLSFFIAICGFHRAFYQVFQATIEHINHIHHANPSVKFLKLKLCEAIRFHINAKM